MDVIGTLTQAPRQQAGVGIVMKLVHAVQVGTLAQAPRQQAGVGTVVKFVHAAQVHA